MLVEQDIENVRRQLDRKDHAEVTLNGVDVRAHTLRDASMLSLTSPVYTGHAYMPSSIRRSLNNKNLPFDRSRLPTFLTIDEARFTVFLHYFGEYNVLEGKSSLKWVLEEFTHQAMEWRLYLDEQDRHDRVYARAR